MAINDSVRAPSQVLEAMYARGALLGEDDSEVPLGWSAVPASAGRYLRDLAVGAGATHTLEIGLACGVSALWLCDALMTGSASGASHVVIDPFEHTWFHGAGLRALREAGVGDLVTHLEEPSYVGLPRLLAEGYTCDFAFIDGDHCFHSALLDCFYAIQLLVPGGLLVMDDVTGLPWGEPVGLAARYLQTNLGMEKLEGDRPGRFAVLRRPDALPDTWIPFCAYRDVRPVRSVIHAYWSLKRRAAQRWPELVARREKGR